MGNLLRNDLKKLFKSKITWISLAVLFVLVIGWLIINDWGPEFYNQHYMLYRLAGMYVLFSVILAIFLPFVAGADFDGGMIRNKIVSGCGRIKIYFSNLIVTCIYSLMLLAVEFVSLFAFYLAVCGSNGFAKFFTPVFVPLLIKVIIHQIVITIGLASFSFAVTMASEKKVVSVILCVAFIFGFGGLSKIRLLATEKCPIIYDEHEDGHVEEKENPFYLPDDSPAKKPIMLIDMTAIPLQGVMHPYYWNEEGMVSTEQLDNKSCVYLEKSDVEMGIPARYFVGALISMSVYTLIGIILFKNKDLK